MNLDTICSEVWKQSVNLSQQEIFEYAEKIGIDIVNERHLLYLAKEALNTKLPDYWKPCLSEEHGEWYYYNTVTGQSQWDHPIDGWYKQVLQETRSAAAGLKHPTDLHHHHRASPQDHLVGGHQHPACQQHHEEGWNKQDTGSMPPAHLSLSPVMSIRSHDEDESVTCRPNKSLSVLQDECSLDTEMSKRLEKLKLDLETEMFDEIKRLRTYFANRFVNVERRKPHQSCSDLTLIKSLKEVVLSQQIQQEEFLRRNVEMKMHQLRNELFDELRKHDTVYKKSFEKKSTFSSKPQQGLVRSKSSSSLLSLTDDSCYDSTFTVTESQTQRLKSSVPSENDKKDISPVCRCNSSLQKNLSNSSDLEDELLPAKLWLLQRAEQLKRKT